MMDVTELGNELNKAIGIEYSGSNGHHLKSRKLELDVLGQSSLILNPEINCRINLTETRDFDSYIRCDSAIRELVKRVLKNKFALILDNLSDEIWMPTSTEYEVKYNHDYVLIRLARPIYVLTSKAIKAKEKNKVLIKEALELYGEELKELIRINGGDPEYFK